MTLDWDGRIRMDPSSPYAMQRLIGLKDRFDVAFACDTDHDRHGIVTRSAGLLPPNHYLAVRDRLPVPAPAAVERRSAAVGKTVVSSALIDRVAARLGRQAVRGAGRLQVVRRRPARRLARLRRRGERRRVLPAPRRHGLDHRQGRHRAGAARRRDDRARGPRSRRAVPRADRANSASRAPTASTRRPRREQKERLARARRREQVDGDRAGRRADRARARQGAGQRRADRRHQGDRRQRLVRRAPVGHRGHLQDLRRELPRSRAPAARSWTRRRRSSTGPLRQRIRRPEPASPPMSRRARRDSP